MWARWDLNPRPPGYEPGALTKLSYGPSNLIPHPRDIKLFESFFRKPFLTHSRIHS